MKKLIKLILFLMIAYPLTGVIFSACSEESDCSMTGRPMVYANMYTINPETKAVLNDTLDSLTVTAFGTDSIIINNQKRFMISPFLYATQVTLPFLCFIIPPVKRYNGYPTNQYSLLPIYGLWIQYETKHYQYSSD